VVVAGLLTWSWASYDPDAFERATFVGPLERAPKLLEAVQGQVGGLSQVRDRVEVLSRQVSAIYAAVEDDAVESTTTILHVSDIHSNPLGLEIVQQLATAFDVDAVLDSGDLTSFGNAVEARIINLIDDLNIPYLFVPGNHDSAANRDAIAAAPGVTLLDGNVVEVGEVRVLGIADPTFTADNAISTEEGNERRISRAGLVADRVRALRPDVLAVHDERLGSASTGLVSVLAAGHTHKRDDRLVDGTRILVVGSTGATGLGAFTVDTKHAYEAELLRFDGDRLVAVDYVKLDGVSGAFGVERRLVKDFEPTPVDRTGPR
jgi:predicted phosphodiesterase